MEDVKQKGIVEVRAVMHGWSITISDLLEASIGLQEEEEIYNRGFTDGVAAGHKEHVARQRKLHGEAVERRQRLNKPWPDHGKHFRNSKLAQSGPNRINAGAGASLSMPTKRTKVEGV